MVPVRVSPLCSQSREIPKSMTRGPSWASSTLAGLRSRWIRDAPWIAVSASTSAAPSALTDRSGKGPLFCTARWREGPGMYAVASHGRGPSGSASTTPAVKKPLTAREAITSRANRCRKAGSWTYSGRMTLIATLRPLGEYPR